jgi:hypothetical protein
MATTFTLPVRAGTDMHQQHIKKLKSPGQKPGLFALIAFYEKR